MTRALVIKVKTPEELTEQLNILFSQNQYVNILHMLQSIDHDNNIILTIIYTTRI